MINTQQVIAFYTGHHLSSEQIGKILGCSRAYVCKILKNAGITPTGRITCDCSYCGVSFEIARSKWRRAKKHYCCEEHYFVSLENVQWQDGTRLARAIVSQHFHLESQHVVHHWDSDNRNNDLDNLVVFGDQAHYIAWHRGNRNRLPIWDGRNDICRAR